MEKNILVIKRKVQATWYQVKPRLKLAFVRLSFLGLLVVLASQKEISLHLEVGQNQNKSFQNAESLNSEPPKVQASLASLGWWELLRDNQGDIKKDLNLANAATAVGMGLTKEEQEQAAKYSNLGLVINQKYAKNHNIDPKIVAFKKQKCLKYVEDYILIAKEESKLFGVPVAITLAQGLLESNAGDSRLAKNDNNHFGIKCKTKCLGCRCANYTDDSKYDMFRIFESPWYSFREHSKLLTGKRYKHLLNLPKGDYKNWANGLQAAGYATDKKYGEKLIKIIESLNLYAYDLE